MLCRVDPLVVESKCRCMRRNQSQQVPRKEATCQGRKQLSSRHLLQAGGQSYVAFTFPPIMDSTEEATRHHQGESSCRHCIWQEDRALSLANFYQVWFPQTSHRRGDLSSSQEAVSLYKIAISKSNADPDSVEMPPPFFMHNPGNRRKQEKVRKRTYHDHIYLTCPAFSPLALRLTFSE